MMIDRTQYDQLNHILWDTRKVQLPPEQVLAYYEERWPFVDQDQLSDKERGLIQELTRTVGKGCFLPAHE